MKYAAICLSNSAKLLRTIAIGSICVCHGFVSAEQLILFSIRTVTEAAEGYLIKPQYGFINKTGEIVIQPKFDSADEFSSVGLANVRINDKWGVVDLSGNLVIPAIYDAVFRFSGNGLAFAKADGKYGVINSKGDWVHLPKWTDANPFSDAGGRWLAAVKTGANWGVLDEQGRVSNSNFDELLFFSKHGLAPAKSNGKWGLIDVSGRYVIAPKFDQMSWNFSLSGRVAAKLNGKWGVISKSGDVVLPFVFEDISWFFGPNEELVVTETPGETSPNRPRVMYLKSSGEPLFANKFDWGSDLNAHGTAIAIVGDSYVQVSSNGTMTRLSELKDEFSATSVNGVYFFRDGNGCPMFVDADMKVLPKWGPYIKSIEMGSEAIAKKYPVLQALSCSVTSSIRK